MKKIKVGYLPLYIKLYDDSNPHYRDPMVDYMHMLIKMLESQGLEVVLADEVCRIKPEFDRAAKKFNDAGVSAVITQHLAYSPSLESIEALLSRADHRLRHHARLSAAEGRQLQGLHQRQPRYPRRAGYVQPAQAER